MNLSRNDFMGCLAEVLRGSGYSVLNGEAVPLFPGKTPDKDGAALMASNRENKRVLDDVKFQVLADAPVLSPEQKADIELAFENEISIDESARLDYASLEIKKAFTALHLSLLPPDKLRSKHRDSVFHDPREKISCISVLPHVQALDEILHGLGFSASVFTTQPVSRKSFDAYLRAFVLPPLALPVRAPEPAEPPSSNFPVIPKSLTIHSAAEIDALLALIKQAWHPDPDRFDGWSHNLRTKLRNYLTYFTDEAEYEAFVTAEVPTTARLKWN
ncbi:unnamed protein product [Rhizophagus irregularis]|uniref:Uncharacterized protein n=1 Tax=Rhizophagus irregularis TaxID=588596 RepID=A0A915ZDB4_9GLOM|nr:unnamed protein product [Rhizophagus irregularis]